MHRLSAARRAYHVVAVPTSYISALVGNKGELVSLASAGAKPLDSVGTDKLMKVWSAFEERDFHKAFSLLATLRNDLQDNPMYWFCTGYVHGEMGNHDLAIAA